MKRFSIFTLILTLVAAPPVLPRAHAQDVGPALDPGLMVGWTAGEAVQYDLKKRSGSAAGKQKRRAATIRRNQPSQQGSAVRLTYVSTAAVKQKALDSYLARLTAQDPDAAKLMAEQFKKNNAGDVYHSLIASTGLRDNDAADNLASYTILGWMIATGSDEPSPTQIRAARNQIAGVMAQNRRLANMSARALFGEEIKLLFVSVHAGWQSAKQQGTLRQYSEGIAKTFGQQSRQTLQSLKLTNAGFVRR